MTARASPLGVVAFWAGRVRGEQWRTMQYEVDPPELHSEAQSLVAALNTIRQVSVARPLTSLGRAMPSSATAAVLGAVETTWAVTLADLRHGVATLAASVDLAAATYDLVEARATAALEAVA